MRTRRFIALLLFAVYLLMAVGAPVASLSCECLSSHDHSELFCTRHGCAASGDHEPRLMAPCCSDHHSTEIELYLVLSDGIGKFLRCAVTDLPPALFADGTALIPFLSGKQAFVERHVPLASDPAVSSPGFRAPPVRS